MEWTDDFEVVLRHHLRLVPADEPIDPVASFSDLGLDSINTIAMLAMAEERLGVFLPDELLVPETFSSPRTLWAALSALVAS